MLAAMALCAAPAAGQADAPTLRVTGQTIYTLRLPAAATDRLPAQAHTVAFDGRARLFLLDRTSGAVWIFGPDGSLDRRVEVGGPARNAMHMSVTREGRIVLSDGAQRALVTIDPARPSDAATHPLGDYVPSGALIPHPSGGVVVQARSLPNRATGAWDRDVHLRWYPLDGRAPRTLRAVAPADGARTGAPGVSSMPLAAVLPDGLAIAADPRVYRVELSSGGRTRTLSRSGTGRAVTEADREWLASRARCTPARVVGPSGPADPGMLAGAGPAVAQRHPERVSAISRMGWSPLRELWIERPGARLDRPGPVDVYRADGSFRGVLAGIGVPDVWTPDGQVAAYLTRDAGCRVTITVRQVVTTPAS